MSIADRVGALAAGRVERSWPLTGGDICRAFRCQLADGRTLFAKSAPAGCDSMMATEAAGLSWLAAGGAPVPDVIGSDGDLIVTGWVEPVRPDVDSARELGKRLAQLHRSGAEAFGSAPPGAVGPGWIGSARLSSTTSLDWPEFFVQHRIWPYLQAARRSGGITAPDYDLVAACCDQIRRFAGPEEPPARLHGDLWGGNILWGASGGVLIDPAGHGGHPETDLAMLTLFPPPHADEIIAGYQYARRLPPGWQRRADLHRLFPLLVHAQLFGGSYGAAAAAAASRVMAAR